MVRLLGFLIGAAIGVLVTRYHLLAPPDVSATRFALDAIGVGAWSEASRKFFDSGAAWKLALGLAVGGALGAAIQYLIERQIHASR